MNPTANLTEDDFRRSLRVASLDLAEIHAQLRRRSEPDRVGEWVR